MSSQQHLATDIFFSSNSVHQVYITTILLKNDNDEATNDTHKTKQSVNPYSVLHTVNNNTEYLTRHEIAGADRTQKYQAHKDGPPLLPSSPMLQKT